MSFKLGNQAEALVKSIFEQCGIECEYNKDENKLVEYDLICKAGKKKFTAEVKYDFMASKTGNLAIEFWNSKKDEPSGISATKADIWVHCIKDEENIAVFICPVDALKKYLKQYSPKRIIHSAGDDNADIMLYDMDELLEIFVRIDNLYKDKAGKVIGKVITCVQKKM